MKTVRLDLPEDVNEHDVKMIVAGVLFEKGLLSSGQAADIAGITKREFLETIGKYGFSVFGETPADLNIHFLE